MYYSIDYVYSTLKFICLYYTFTNILDTVFSYIIFINFTTLYYIYKLMFISTLRMSCDASAYKCRKILVNFS
jgi:hypothetical protein